jgi:hypothetical protein
LKESINVIINNNSIFQEQMCEHSIVYYVHLSCYSATRAAFYHPDREQLTYHWHHYRGLVNAEDMEGREKQLQRVLLNTVDFYASIKWIAGNSNPDVKLLEGDAE